MTSTKRDTYEIYYRDVHGFNHALVEAYCMKDAVEYIESKSKDNKILRVNVRGETVQVRPGQDLMELTKQFELCLKNLAEIRKVRFLNKGSGAVYVYAGIEDSQEDDRFIFGWNLLLRIWRHMLLRSRYAAD